MERVECFERRPRLGSRKAPLVKGVKRCRFSGSLNSLGGSCLEPNDAFFFARIAGSLDQQERGSRFVKLITDLSNRCPTIFLLRTRESGREDHEREGNETRGSDTRGAETTIGRESGESKNDEWSRPVITLIP